LSLKFKTLKFPWGEFPLVGKSWFVSKYGGNLHRSKFVHLCMIVHRIDSRIDLRWSLKTFFRAKKRYPTSYLSLCSLCTAKSQLFNTDVYSSSVISGSHCERQQIARRKSRSCAVASTLYWQRLHGLLSIYSGNFDVRVDTL